MIVLEGVLGRCHLFDATSNQAFFFFGEGRNSGDWQRPGKPLTSQRYKEEGRPDRRLRLLPHR